MTKLESLLSRLGKENLQLRDAHKELAQLIGELPLSPFRIEYTCRNRRGVVDVDKDNPEYVGVWHCRACEGRCDADHCQDAADGEDTFYLTPSELLEAIIGDLTNQVADNKDRLRMRNKQIRSLRQALRK